MELFIEIIGWIGMVMIVAAFVWKRKLPPMTLAVMNFVGATLLGVSLIFKEAWAGVALEAVWMVVAANDFRIACRRGSPKA